MEKDKKYFWLKLKKDFFKRHDIQVIESMDNGKDYVLFYLKLLLESVDHQGELRFSDTIPYDDKMLSVITNTNIDTVRSAMRVFYDLGMVELLEDRTIYMQEVEKMLGSETYWAKKKREEREKKEKLPINPQKIGQCPTSVQPLSNLSKQEIELDIELDIEKDIKKKNKQKKKASAEDFQNIFSSYTSDAELLRALNDYLEMRMSLKEKPTLKAIDLIVKKLDKIATTDQEKAEILDNSTMNNWKGIFPLEKQHSGNQKRVIRQEPEPDWLNQTQESNQQKVIDPEQIKKNQELWEDIKRMQQK